MSLEGVDFSFGRPGGAALAAAGKRFAMRYVPYTGDGGKGLTPAELADLHAHGIAVGLVFESSKGRMLLGKNAGRQDGQTALNALNRLGFPASRPVYFAVDFNAIAGQQPVIDAYLDGAAQVLQPHRVGVYGSVYVVERCVANRSALWYWQTYAWSNGVVSPHAHLLQYRNGQSINGAAVDFCKAFKPDFGAWSPLPETDTEASVKVLNSNGLLAPDGRPLTLLPVPAGAAFTTVSGTAGTFSGAAKVPVIATVDSDPHTYLVLVTTKVGWADGIARDTPVIVTSTATRVPNPAPADTATPYSAADLDAAKAAEHERTRASAIAAVEAIP